jgi:bifunctional non-homologous end joining protein LigD
MPHSRSKASAAAATYIPPMKALGVTAVPTGVWRCEIKFDGYRAIALVNRGRAELWSRNRKEMSADYPEIVAALEKLPCDSAVLDGEIVALDAAGRSRFQLLQAREIGERPPILFYVFDALQRDGRLLLDRPIEERRRELETLLRKAPRPVQLSPLFEVQPAELMDAAHKQGLEGIIAKRSGSVYEPARRSGAWLKCKVVLEQEFVIGGFSEPRLSREHFGAILIGYYEGGKLLYAGKVGTGFNRELLRSLHAQFLARRIETCPFANLPMPRRPRFGQGMTRSEMKKVTWIRPELVAQIKFGEWTEDRILRQPVFLGLRKDKKAQEVRREPTTAAPKPKKKSAARKREDLAKSK